MSHRLPLVLAIALWIAGAALRLIHMGDVAGRTPDERVYAAQAAAVLREGVSGVRRMAAAYLEDPSLRLYPPPTRIAYVAALAGVMKATGITDERAGAWLSCVASILAIGVAILIGFRFFEPWVGAGAALLMATFPPDLVVARRCWQESLVSLLGLITLYCALRGIPVAFALCCAVSLAVKEGAIIYCAAVAAVSPVRRIVPAFLIGSIAGISVIAWSAGGFGVVASIIRGIPGANAVNPYALQYASSPPYEFLLGLWILSPATLVLAAIGIASNRRAIPLACAVLVMAAAVMFAPHWQNFRYLAVVFGPACLLGAIGSTWVAARLQQAADPTIATSIALAVMLVLCAADYQYYDRVFVKQRTPDLSIRMVLGAR